MFVYKDIVNNVNYVYIHIPKNSGRYIRQKIQRNNNNSIIKYYFGEDKVFDFAHIPYIKREKYVPNFDTNEYQYYAHSRNPYDRIISAYIYKNKNNDIINFDIL